MPEKILLISEKQEDLKLFQGVLDNDRFIITRIRSYRDAETDILENHYALILADYDSVSDEVDLFFKLQKERSKASLIFYGEKFGAEEVSQALQKGAYSIIPRALIAERVYDAVIGGLENRKAFIEILGMMSELKDVNKELKKEKTSLKKKNQELSFINRLSNEISYDQQWDNILSRIIITGIEKIQGYSIFGLFFWLGDNWNLSAHLAEKCYFMDEENTKTEILSQIFNHKRDIRTRIDSVRFQLVRPEAVENSVQHTIPRLKIFPLALAGEYLGSVFISLKGNRRLKRNKEELIITISNLLSLSLKNAQEYHRLRESAVTDSLTGIYNRKGLDDFLKREYQRARRHDKPLSFVMIDLDAFKAINDKLGHQAGDHVLQEFAKCLKSIIRKSDVIFRYGGDEFAVLLPETEMRDAEILMNRMVNKLSRNVFKWNLEKFNVKISYGISSTRELPEGDTPEDLIRQADLRLLSLKQT